MRVIILYISIFLNCFFVLGQNDVAIKIYLEDAETSKNISDAIVTLEGFEIPAIKGKYDKKGKFYYFTEIPKGYNTVMAYHKKYNEKGFQDLNRLPVVLKFSLQDKKNRSYSFLKVTDSLYDNKKKKVVKSVIYKERYVEDPFKIVITPKDVMEYNDFKEFINQKIEELNIEIVLVNPYWERNKIDEGPFDISQKEGYPYIDENNSQEIDGKYLFPLMSGLSNMDNTFFETHYSNKINDVCFIFRKKDGSKFKRFNDPNIRKLKTEKVNVFSIILNKKNNTIRSLSSSKKGFRIRDRLNREFNNKYAIDSSKIFFYNNNFRNHNKPFFLFKKKDPNIIYEPSGERQVPTFLVIKNDNTEIPRYLPVILNENDEVQQKILLQDRSVGLGILDQYEYYSTVN